MLYLHEPEKFNPKFKVAGCFLEYQGKFLVLLRLPHKPHGNTWGLPSGKLEPGENAVQAVMREIFEETGLAIEEEKILPVQKTYVRIPDHDFIYYIYKTILDKPVEITLEPSGHQEYRWVTPEESLTLSTVPDFGPCVKITYNI